jgi:hypothetical protein
MITGEDDWTPDEPLTVDEIDTASDDLKDDEPGLRDIEGDARLAGITVTSGLPREFVLVLVITAREVGLLDSPDTEGVEVPWIVVTN